MRAHSKKVFGFSSIELMLALILIGTAAYLTLSFSNGILFQSPGQSLATQSYHYTNAVVRYISTHQNLLRQILSKNGETNGKVATVSTQVLVNEGFIKNSLFYKNKLGQSPCTVIWYDKKQLQSFIYYRDNNDSRKLDKNQWKYGLNHMGAMMGLYENNNVISAGKDWAMESGFIKTMFVRQGSADISGGGNPELYACSESQVANPSFVVNVSSMLALDNRLPNDDTIHQYQDILHDVDDPQSNNRMNDDLNMDYTRPGSTERTQSNIIFQMNPDCQLDPRDETTMQDYDSRVNGDGKKGLKVANSRGCKNRQLAIVMAKDPIESNSNTPVMMVTGFQRGGSLADKGWKDIEGNDLRPFVGEVKAASFQPTTQIAVGTPCDPREVGTMGRQQRSPDPDDVNNIYVSQVVCMKSPLCAESTQGFCYMPIQNVTFQAEPKNTNTYTCPLGTFIDKASIAINEVSIQNQITCVANKGSVIYPEVNCVATNPRRDDLVYSNLLGTAFKTIAPIYRTVTIPSTSWEQWCGNPVHAGCGEGRGQIADTQDTIRLIQCTNDPSKAAVVIQK